MMKEILKFSIVIIITLVGVYYYYDDDNPQHVQIQIENNIVSVPAGQRATLRLSDGTQVWLNAKSRIEYPATFSSRTRDIKLEGEAYFEVARNTKLPFIVHTQNYDIEVLGTKFNVEAYPDLDEFRTSLFEGSVKIINSKQKEQTVELGKYEEFVIRNNMFSKISIIDHDKFLWREGLISFKNIRFEDLMKRLEKFYDVKIIIQSKSAQNYAFTGKFRVADGLDNVLNILQKDAKYSYIKSADKTTVFIQ